jgi:thioredoxin 1
MANETNDSTFDADVLKSTIPVLVDFWAPWCGPCRMLTPVMEKISQKVTGKAKILKVNVDESPGVASRYGVMSIPTVIIFKNGQVKQQFVGVQPEQVYLDAIN